MLRSILRIWILKVNDDFEPHVQTNGKKPAFILFNLVRKVWVFLSFSFGNIGHISRTEQK